MPRPAATLPVKATPLDSRIIHDPPSLLVGGKQVRVEAGGCPGPADRRRGLGGRSTPCVERIHALVGHVTLSPWAVESPRLARHGPPRGLRGTVEPVSLSSRPGGAPRTRSISGGVLGRAWAVGARARAPPGTSFKMARAARHVDVGATSPRSSRSSWSRDAPLPSCATRPCSGGARSLEERLEGRPRPA